MKEKVFIHLKFQDLDLEVLKDEKYEWLLETNLVAKGYGVGSSAILNHKMRKADELFEGQHWVSQFVITSGGKQSKIFWTKEGVIYLGFFIKSERAKIFRSWASKLILNHLESKPSIDLSTLESKLDNLTKVVEEIQDEQALQDFRFRTHLQAIRDLSKRDTKLLVARLEKIEEKFAPLSLDARIAYVYLLRKIGTQECKVGKSVAPPSRVSAFEQAGVELELLSTIKFPNENSAFAFEKALKVIFKSKHLRGEWYLLAEQDIALFVSLAKVFAGWF